MTKSFIKKNYHFSRSPYSRIIPRFTTAQISLGTITSAIGLIFSVRYFEFARDANNRLDKILK
ncbi:MAG: hypothetical protein AAGE84_03965 [Cyanobacteria bacterium P01_G01_bin.39]